MTVWLPIVKLASVTVQQHCDFKISLVRIFIRHFELTISLVHIFIRHFISLVRIFIGHVNVTIHHSQQGMLVQLLASY
jgi:hypothetical protein